MKITSIKSIKHRIFRDFKWAGRGLADFARYNLIYGWNYSGKTTFANLFQHVEERTPLAEGEAIFVCDPAGEIELTKIDSTTVLPSIKVFNKTFVEKHVSFSSEDLTTPIFVVIGESAPEKQALLDQKRRERENTESGIIKHNSSLKKAESSRDEYGTEQARTIKDILGKPDNTFWNYRRPNFERACSDNGNSVELSDSDYQIALSEKDAKPKDNIVFAMPIQPDLNIVYSEVKELLYLDITSVPIDDLLADSVLSEWTRTGLRIHEDKHSGKCLFCLNDLGENRLQQLRAHFDKSFDDLMVKLDKAKVKLQNFVGELEKVSFPDETRLYDHLSTRYKEIELRMRAEIAKISEVYKGLLSEIETKQSNPFKLLSISTPIIKIDSSILVAFSAILQEHNEYATLIREHVRAAESRLHNHIICTRIAHFRDLEKAVEEATKALQLEEQNNIVIKNAISVLERELKSHRPAVDALNLDLKNYLGHSDLQLEVENTGYRLKRNGQYANDLSEGEKTAFAFLYYLQTLNQDGFDIKKSIIVVDDPVSSLDSNSLFYAFGFMRANIRDANQIFILTHNFQFFAMVRQWFRHIPKRDKVTKYYQMTRNIIDGKRNAGLSPLDKLLMEKESEYHYLFSTLQARAAQPDGIYDLEHDYSYPNMARRLLESFLGFKYPEEEKFYRRIERTGFDPSKRLRIERYVQAGSHEEAGIPESPFDASLLAETGSVMGDILDMIRHVDNVHYDGLIALSAATTLSVTSPMTSTP